jgi:hypothetical protein
VRDAHIPAAGQHTQASGQFELKQRALQQRAVHVGALGENFKRRGRMTERVEQASSFGWRACIARPSASAVNGCANTSSGSPKVAADGGVLPA